MDKKQHISGESTVNRVVVITEDGEYYGPFETEHEASNWANTNVYVDFTVEPFDTNKMVETNRG